MTTVNNAINEIKDASKPLKEVFEKYFGAIKIIMGTTKDFPFIIEIDLCKIEAIQQEQNNIKC